MSAQPEHFPLPSPTPVQAPRCHLCGSSQHLTVDTIGAHHDLTSGLVEVGYNCEKCGSFLAHAATVADVADVLHRSTNPPGLLQFGNHHLHCGVPMHTGAGKQHVLMVDATGQTVDPELEVYLNTRVLHCDECGFQMEIPE